MLPLQVLRRQDDETSSRIVQVLTSHASFSDLSKREGQDIVQRDREDEVKLAVGIKLAVAKGVLPGDLAPPQAFRISVVGKSADRVCSELVSHLGDLHTAAGRAIVLQGLSGTGKGTTVKKLQVILPKCVCWSNGNVFRTATWLLNSQAAKEGAEFSSSFLTPQRLAAVFERLSFERFSDTDYDVVIDKVTRVASIANTELKAPIISSRVPTVAEQTQGEVVLFASRAVETLKSAGFNVILEGRAQTLNFIPTPYRFELVIDDPRLLGERRAAQRVMAEAIKHCDAAADEHSNVVECVKSASDRLASAP